MSLMLQFGPEPLCLKLYMFPLGVHDQFISILPYIIIYVIVLSIRFIVAVNMTSLKLKMCFTMYLV